MFAQTCGLNKVSLNSLRGPHGAQFDPNEAAHMVATRIQAMLVN